jgi:hypothetical protein
MPTPVHEQNKIFHDQIEKDEQQIQAMQASISRSNEVLAEVLSHANPQTGLPTYDHDIALLQGEITSIKSDVANMQTSVDKLNAALLTTPDKALAVPLIRKDLDDFRLANQRDIDSMRLEMGRAYELNKWLIGFLLAAVVGTILNNILQQRGASAATK